MKKFIPLLIIVLIGSFFGFRYYFNHTGEPYYVKITTDGEKKQGKDDTGTKVITSYSYSLSGYNEDGKEQQIEFKSFSDRQLRKGAFLKLIWNKRKGVIDWSEVQEKELPKKVKEQLEKQ
ncbi:YxeA family protein [Enterococcus faecalis]|uniref:YxeA family protein n=1 Tax=Enterococcus faecalis TaxID=1351 RepID=UPI00189729C8|nr:YxeA family protein [Enterococcus faecalis]